MGWGILFIGYFMAFFLPMPPLALAGLALVAWALYKLTDYRPGLMSALYWTIPLGICALLESLVLVSKLLPYMGVALPEMPWLSIATAIVSMVKCALALCFHVTFLRQLRGFASELELPGIAKRADWGLWIVCVQSSCYIVAMILELIGWKLELFSLIAYLLQFVWAIFNLVNLFTCYMYICPEGDEDMERKPSRFGFVNDFREKMDQRDRAAREKEAAYMERKRQNKNQKKKRK